MLKKGFTLAEVLVTLGIIGVVAALTTPALIQNIGNAKVGPTLSKAVSTFTVANETMLAEEESGSITGLTLDPIEYTTKLSKYMKITQLESKDIPKDYKYYSSSNSYPAHGRFHEKILDPSYPEDHEANAHAKSWQAYTGEDNVLYYVLLDSKSTPHGRYADIPNNQLIGEVYIDINGVAAPNRQAKDVYRFYFYNDGTLRPYGAAGYDRRYSSTPNRWQNDCNGSHIYDADTCAGSIFENNLKVIYR